MSRHCLVIDDDVEIMLIICKILGEHNFTTHGVSSAKEALELGVEKISSFDLIFTDLKMPQIDSFEFIAMVRDLGIECPIVAITGLSDKGQEIYERDDGIKRKLPDHIISKPFSSQDIKQLI